MRLLAVLPLLLAASLAGCVDPGGPATPLTGEGAGPGGSGATTGAPLANNTTLPTLGPAVDPWLPGETERLLYEGTVESGPPGCTMYIAAENELWAGCVNFWLPEGTLVPEGTVALRIEGDASGAQRYGRWGAFLMATRVRSWSLGAEWATGEPVATPTGAWRFPLEPEDWDLATQAESAFYFHWMGHGDQANMLVGPVKGKVFAERDPNWTAAAPLDRWRIPEAHAIPQEGVITLLDANLSYRQTNSVTGFNGRDEDWQAVEDLVPPGAAQVVVAAAWSEVRGCPEGFECSVRIDVGQARAFYGGYSQHPPVEVGPGHVLYVFTVPDDLAPEPDYLNESLVEVFAYAFNQCPESPEQLVEDFVGDCKRTFTDVSFDVRLLVEAWRQEADLTAVKARLGVA